MSLLVSVYCTDSDILVQFDVTIQEFLYIKAFLLSFDTIEPTKNIFQPITVNLYIITGSLWRGGKWPSILATM